MLRADRGARFKFKMFCESDFSYIYYTILGEPHGAAERGSGGANQQTGGAVACRTSYGANGSGADSHNGQCDKRNSELILAVSPAQRPSLSVEPAV